MAFLSFKNCCSHAVKIVGQFLNIRYWEELFAGFKAFLKHLFHNFSLFQESLFQDIDLLQNHGIVSYLLLQNYCLFESNF